MKFGFHVSIAGSIDRSVDRALELGCDAFQIFTRSPRMWKAKELKQNEVDMFREKLKASKLYVNGHMPYLPNLASPKEEVYRKSVDLFTEELTRCDVLELPYLVSHLGSHLGTGAQAGIKQIKKALDKNLGNNNKVNVLLENGAGGTNTIGSNFKEISLILDGLKYGDEVGLCFDTCHAYSAGYDLRTREGVESVIGILEDSVGFDRVKLIHLNDCKGSLGSGLDRHEHIGLGKIGLQGFKALLESQFSRLPMIMETPVDARRDDQGNMIVIRELASSI